jgi:hypothetical protein
MLALLFGLMLLAIFLIVLASHFISTNLYRRLVRGGNSYPKTIRVIAFIASFLVIFLVVAYLFITNVRFER